MFPVKNCSAKQSWQCIMCDNMNNSTTKDHLFLVSNFFVQPICTAVWWDILPVLMRISIQYPDRNYDHLGEGKHVMSTSLDNSIRHKRLTYASREPPRASLPSAPVPRLSRRRRLGRLGFPPSVRDQGRTERPNWSTAAPPPHHWVPQHRFERRSPGGRRPNRPRSTVDGRWRRVVGQGRVWGEARDGSGSEGWWEESGRGGEGRGEGREGKQRRRDGGAVLGAAEG